MNVRKVSAIVDTKENDKWDLNRNIRQSHNKKKLKEREKSILTENKKMFSRLYSIVRRPHPFKTNESGKGPVTLNKVGRKMELKRIMKWNREILKSIKEAKPSMTLNELKKRFDETERYKSIARMYTEYGK
jgi:hypothetical protein